MEELLKRAEGQRVINALDYKRISSNIGMRDDFVVIDSINGVRVASLFSRDESLLDRAKLQGGITSKDFGRLSSGDKRDLQIRGIRIDDSLQTVDVFDAELLARSEFNAMSNIQKEEALKTKKVVDKLPDPDLTRDTIHEITLHIARLTEAEDGAAAATPGEEDVQD